MLTCPAGRGLADQEATTLIRNPFQSWLPKIEQPKPSSPLEAEPLAAQPQEAPVPIEPPKLQVSGIVWNTKKPQAIIDEKVVTIGDIVQDSKIVDIHKDGVDIIYKEIMFTVPVNQTLTQPT